MTPEPSNISELEFVQDPHPLRGNLIDGRIENVFDDASPEYANATHEIRVGFRPQSPSEFVAVVFEIKREKNPDHAQMDRAEAALAQMTPIECPVSHYFIPGFYVRTIFMPAGAAVASRIHDTRNPFWITKGRLEVQENGVTTMITAPYVGITEPGARRLLLIHEDCTWTTFHANPDEERDIPTLEKRLTRPHVNSVFGVDQAEMKALQKSVHESKAEPAHELTR